jgi:amino acid transporter
MVAISVLGLYWLQQDHQSYIQFTYDSFLPELDKVDNWIFLSSILYSLLGIEISAYHAQDVHNPQKNFPRALLLSAVIILLTIIFSSLAVAIVIPEPVLKASLISSMLDAFKIFFTNLDLAYLFPVTCLLIAIGTLGGVGAWLIGPSKGLLIAAEDGHLPPFLAQKNAKGAPKNILITQGIIFSGLSTAYILMPNVNSAFFILSILTAQLSLFGYIFMFMAVIKLRITRPNMKRSFKIPFGKPGLYLVSGSGITSCVLAILLSFLPPEHIAVGNYLSYELMLVGSFLLFLLAIYKLSRS